MGEHAVDQEQHQRQRGADLVADVVEQPLARLLGLLEVLHRRRQLVAGAGQLDRALLDALLEALVVRGERALIEGLLHRQHHRRQQPLDARDGVGAGRHQLDLQAAEGGVAAHQREVAELGRGGATLGVERLAVIEHQRGVATASVFDQRGAHRAQHLVGRQRPQRQVGDAVGGGELRRLARELLARALELEHAILQRLVRGLQLARRRAHGERPEQRAPDAGEEPRASRHRDVEATAAGDPRQLDLGRRIAEQARHLDEVALGDDVELPAHLEALGQRQLDLAGVLGEIAVLRRDAGEHLVAGALARLVHPPVEAHRRQEQPTDDEDEAQARRSQPRPADLHQLLVGEVLAHVGHDAVVHRPVHALVLVHERRQGHVGVVEQHRGIDGAAAQVLHEHREDLVGHFLHDGPRPQRSTAAPRTMPTPPARIITRSPSTGARASSTSGTLEE